MSGTDHKGSYYPSIDAMWQHEINLKNQENHSHTIKTNTNTNINNNNHISNQKTNNNIQINPELKSAQKTKIIDPIGSLQNWYTNANKYWSAAQATYNGVLNGYGNLSQIDIAGSMNFIKSYMLNKTNMNSKFKPNRVLDCGAGIGRIAKQMLCELFTTVDVIDQCQKYVEKSKQILKDKNIGHFYAKGLQQFTFQQKYDCIWIQWVLSHLTDRDAVSFLKSAKNSLNQDGFIVVKQNHCKKGFQVDKDDCSVSRSTELYKKLFQEANLKVMKQEQQKWPDDLLDVKMYILQ